MRLRDRTTRASNAALTTLRRAFHVPSPSALLAEGGAQGFVDDLNTAVEARAQQIAAQAHRDRLSREESRTHVCDRTCWPADRRPEFDHRSVCTALNIGYRPRHAARVPADDDTQTGTIPAVVILPPSELVTERVYPNSFSALRMTPPAPRAGLYAVTIGNRSTPYSADPSPNFLDPWMAPS